MNKKIREVVSFSIRCRKVKMTLIRNGKPLLLYAYYHITNNISNNVKVSLSAKALLSNESIQNE